ncbi:MAG: hypothetical protein Q9170_005344, partial [Blastenia crenularia]
MPSYLCHLCTAYNPFPSPVCKTCTHTYCIACLPVIPNPSPLRTSFTYSEYDGDGGSGYSSTSESMLEEVRNIHPAYRRITIRVEERDEEEVEDEGGFYWGRGIDVVGDEEEGKRGGSEEEPTVQIQAPTPEEHYFPPVFDPEPLFHHEDPLQNQIQHPCSSQISIQLPSLLTIDEPPIKREKDPIPLHLSDWPPWETLTPKPESLHPHMRHKSVEKFEHDLRRTMSVQGERVS